MALDAGGGDDVLLPALYDPATRSETLLGAAVPVAAADVTASAKVPLSELPQLSSLPGAPATLFLDFDGSTADNLTPFTRDSDRTTYSDAELTEIRDIFVRVSEFFSPFKLNVTTIDPKSYQAYKVSRIVMTDDNQGAWAYVSSFRTGGGGFGRVGNDGWGNANDMAMVIAHEAGHTFGLEHQSTFDSSGRETQEYNPGNSSVGPIMGAPYGSQRQLWWDGPTYSANPSTYQDDLAILSSTDNRFGYRPDDVPGSLSQARELTAVDGSYAFAGLITRTTDRDAFRFTVTEASRATIRGDVADNGSAMLNLKLQIYDSEGELLSTRDGAGMGESATLTLEPGEYRVVVASHGDYGDIGQYRLQINILPVAWQRTLVGGGTSTAGASYLDQVLRVDGAGREIGGTVDGFQFVHQPLTGDGSLETEIQRLNEDNTTLRAGVMIRENTNASSAFVAVLYIPGDGVEMRWRDATGETAVAQDPAAVKGPVWVRLSRHGNEFVGEYSLDGTAWTELDRHTVALDPSTRIGLAVSARGTADARVFFGNLTLSLGAAAGDIDGDGAVDLVDFGILKEHFGAPSATRSDGDLSGDGRVDLDDFGILKANFAPAALAGLLIQQRPTAGTSALSSEAETAEAVVGLAFAAWEAEEDQLA
ncbi:MAG: dockerin type I domain-containing protein [Pirellulales bacterium]